MTLRSSQDTPVANATRLATLYAITPVANATRLAILYAIIIRDDISAGCDCRTSLEKPQGDSALSTGARRPSREASLAAVYALSANYNDAASWQI
jgi:hypothetical protein